MFLFKKVFDDDKSFHVYDRLVLSNRIFKTQQVKVF